MVAAGQDGDFNEIPIPELSCSGFNKQVAVDLGSKYLHISDNAVVRDGFGLTASAVTVLFKMLFKVSMGMVLKHAKVSDERVQPVALTIDW